MIYTGLVSVSFRQLSPKQIIQLVKDNGLDGIEWGGDVHVPHGDIKQAGDVYRMTNESGLKVAAYGSYYKVGCGMEFDPILETAIALKAPVIRVWAGNKSSEEADEAWWNKVVKESHDIANLAAKHHIKVAYEYHANTLTDTNESALRLLKEVNHPNMMSYWQPPVGTSEEYCVEGLKQMTDWLTNIHVYYIKDKAMEPLKDGIKQWTKYLKTISQLQGERYAMLEFVKNNEIQQFVEDAQILKDMVKSKVFNDTEK